MPASAKLDVQTKSHRIADAIAKSLCPEIDHPTGSRAHVRVKVERRKLRLTFQARDATALRAVMNSYLRMIGACLRVTETIDNSTEQE